MRRLGRVGFVALAGSVVLAGVPALAGIAAASPMTLVTESFTSASTTSANWVLPAASGSAAANDACLTAGTDTSQLPVPGCAQGASGTVPGLQLTTNGFNQEGGLAYGLSVPTSQGLDVTFTTDQYDGGGADGLTFFLAGSDPTDPASSPITLGPAGGALGYEASNGNDGLTDAYLGVGLDAYGNFTNPIGSGYTNPVNQGGCGQTPVFAPGQLEVRGPGDGESGYCLLGRTSANLLDSGAGVNPVPVEVAINPSASPITTASGLDVPAGGYVVTIVDAGGTQDTVTGSLPSADGYLPASWLGSGGIPLQLTFGWSAATGSVNDYHTISDVTVDSLTGVPPQLAVSLSDNSGGNARSGQTVTYTAATTVSASDENKPITLTDTFPADLVPQTTGLGGAGWTCSANGQTVTCTSTAPAAVGDTISVAMPVLVSVASGSAPVSSPDMVTVSSDDANPSNATDTETYQAPLPTATTLSFATQPLDSQVNAAMLNPDGTQTDLQVAALITPNGAVDTNYSGTVTLAFKNNPGNASFVVNGSPVSTMSAPASNGIAHFSPVIINAVGFGDTLTATATRLTPAISGPFDVNSAQTTCASGQSCSTTTTSPATGQTATVSAAASPGAAVITASFGGNVAPIHPCTTSAAGILSFSGDRQKTITLTIATKIPILLFCYGQPTPFLNVLYQKTTFFNTVNNEYEGLLPACLPTLTGPCISGLTLTKTTEKVTIRSGSADPHVSH